MTLLLFSCRSTVARGTLSLVKLVKCWQRRPQSWVSLWNCVDFVWPLQSMRPGSLVYIVTLWRYCVHFTAHPSYSGKHEDFVWKCAHRHRQPRPRHIWVLNSSVQLSVRLFPGDQNNAVARGGYWLLGTFLLYENINPLWPINQQFLIPRISKHLLILKCSGLLLAST